MQPLTLNKHSRRKELLRNRQVNTGEPEINGIDYLEVDPEDQKILWVYLLKPASQGKANGEPPPPSLTAANVLIEGGVRVQNIRATALQIDDENPRRLNVTVSEAGDFSFYTFRLVKSRSNPSAPPDNFDALLASIQFSFKANCQSPFDCRAAKPPEGTLRPAPVIDYLAKDYQGFRQLMLDRMSLLMPGWQDRGAADLQVMLTEMLAYVADQLSYYQDAVATEAYLGTARQRISLRRHARLLDYSVHEGCNARVWLHIIPKYEFTLPKQIPFWTQPENGDGSVVFETMQETAISPLFNEFEIYTEGEDVYCLPEGCVQAGLL